METVHTCGPAISGNPNYFPAISDEIYLNRDGFWYAGDDEGETTVRVKFCPFCGVELSTLEPPNKQNVADR